MANDIIQFTYQITYPPRIYVLIHFYERNEIQKINPDFRESYLQDVSSFIKDLKERINNNDKEPRKALILDTLEGIIQLNDYLLDLWKIEPNTQRKTIKSNQDTLILA